MAVIQVGKILCAGPEPVSAVDRWKFRTRPPAWLHGSRLASVRKSCTSSLFSR
jgi:hypothetical protein